MYVCTVQWYFWHVRPTSDARRVRLTSSRCQRWVSGDTRCHHLIAEDVCVSWSPVKGVQVVRHAIPIANSCPRWHPFHTLGPSSTTLWDSCGRQVTGACSRGFQRAPVSWFFGLPGHSLGAVPQPRLLSPLRSSSQVSQEKCRHVSVLLS